MQLNDATRIIDVIDLRIRRATASEARVETTWGEVAAVSADGRYADLYLYGESAPYTSDYFRVPNALSVNVGDSVKAAIDRERGDRWVEEVHSFATYNKVEFDIVDGEIRLGSGSAAPELRVKYNGSYAGKVQWDFADPSGAAGQQLLVTAYGVTQAQQGGFAVRNTGDTNYRARLINSIDGANQRPGLLLGDGSAAADVNLYRDAADSLKTDDNLVVAGGTVYVGVDGATAGFLHVFGSGPDEGGEIILYGAAAHDDWHIDNYQGRIRWFVGGSVYMDVGSARLNVSAGDKITLGTAEDTNLYRESANVLATDDLFKVKHTNGLVGNIAAGNHLLRNFLSGSDTQPKFRISSDGTVEWGVGGSTAIDTNLYRAAANELKTDDMFTTPIVGAEYSGGTATTGIAAGTISANLSWGTKASDTGNSYNATTKDWTCPVAGVYLVVVNVNVVNQTNAVTAGVRTNLTKGGVTIASDFIAPGNGSTNIRGTIVHLGTLAAGDVLAVNANPIVNPADVSIPHIAIVRVHSGAFLA